MYYFLYGTDSHKSRQKLHDLLDLAKKKRSEAEVFKINTENWRDEQFDELLVSQGLFSQKYTTVLDNVFENKEIKSYVLDRLKEMKESEQIFLLLESSIDSVSLKKIEKYAEKVQEFEKKEVVKKDNSIFSIGDGLITKDKKKLWVTFIDFLNKGIAVEEIHGILFWQIKNMLIASKSGPSESGLNPYVYKNALTGSRQYKTDELGEMSESLVGMTHKVRQGEGDLEIFLEKWILSL